MAKRTEGVTEKLLKCAQEEFLFCGYEGASLRVIAEKAGSSKGAIYIRYPDKESLYLALVQPAADGLCELLERLLSSFEVLAPDEKKSSLMNYSNSGFSKLIDYIYDHFTEFKLLVCSGENNAFQLLLHRIIEIDNVSTMRFVEQTGNDAIVSGRLTPELLHLLSSAFYSGVFEVVMHDMPKEAAAEHIQRMRSFFNAGWQAVFYENRGDKNG